MEMAGFRFRRSKWLVAGVVIIGLGGLAWLAVRLAPSPPKSRSTPESVAVSSDKSMKAGAAVRIAAVGKSETTAIPFRDEPAAHALYNQMLDALRKAKSVSFEGRFQDEHKGQVRKYAYRAWLEKPNYFRVEAENLSEKTSGILVGDGQMLWIYWPQGRPKWEYVNAANTDRTSRLTSYMKKYAPLGAHSIWHEMVWLGVGVPVIELSTFHGYNDCLQQYIDGVRALGTQKVGTEDCDGIEVQHHEGATKLVSLALPPRPSAAKDENRPADGARLRHR